MGSKGSPQVIWRCPTDLLAEIQADIELSHRTRRGEPWSVSEYVRVAVKELLRKRRASRDSSKRGQAKLLEIADVLAAYEQLPKNDHNDGVNLGDELHIEYPSIAEQAAITAAANEDFEREFGKYTPRK